MAVSVVMTSSTIVIHRQEALVKVYSDKHIHWLVLNQAVGVLDQLLHF